MAFPNFFGKQYESASNFLDDLEMAFLVSGRDEEEVKLRAFPLVLKDSAKNWFQNLEPGRKTNWETVKETFLSKYGGLDNPEHLWHRISSLHQATSRTYLTYESQFLRLWAEWKASLAEGERAPNFLKKEKFLAGLFPDLQEKVKGKFPETFEEALQIARVKDQKLEYQAHTSRVEHPQGPTMADERLPPAPTTTPEDPHLELLQRVTNQLDNLSINMVQGVRQQQPQPNNERMPNGPRRQPQRRDYFCYNCGEEGHGMYFCPHPRNFNAQAGRGRQQVTPPRARPPPQIQPQILQNPQMVAQPQVLQRSEAPQPVAEIPPLPNNNGGSSHTYFTRLRARQLGLQQGGDDQNQPQSLEGDDSDMSTESSEDDFDSTQSYPGAAAQGIVDSFPHVLAVAALQQAIQPRRRLQFNPLPSRPNNRRVPPNRPLNMAAAARADLRIKFGSFSGKSKEDPDCHVAQFETRWQARGFAGVYDAQAKMRQFEATFEGKAVQWFSNFDVAHFPNYEELKTAFLNRFRVEKTVNDVLTKLKEVRQKKMFVEDYAQKFNRYVRRLTPQERPTDEMLAAYFVRGLREELRNAVASVDVAQGLNELINTAARTEKRFGLTGSSSKKGSSKKKKKGKGKKKMSDDSSDDDLETDTESDTDSSSKCVEQESEVMAVTRSKAKLKSPLDWEEQKDIREEVTEEILNDQKEEGKHKRKKRMVEKEEQEEDKSEALFKEMLNSPLTFTLDQLLSLVPMFRDRIWMVNKAENISVRYVEVESEVWVESEFGQRKCQQGMQGVCQTNTRRRIQREGTIDGNHYVEKNLFTQNKDYGAPRKQVIMGTQKGGLAWGAHFECRRHYNSVRASQVPVVQVGGDVHSEFEWSFSERLEMFSESLRKKFFMQPLEHSGTAMTKTRAMKETLKELKAPATEVQQLSDDEVDEEAQSDETELIEGLDLHDEETKVWLQRTGLYEFAHLPWEEWQQNTYAEQQMQCLRDNKGYITEDTEVTTKMVAEVFKLPNKQGAKLRKMTDSIMKGEFGPPEGTRSYYMVRNADKLRCRHLFWYLEKICLLAKTSYMSKEAFMPIWNAERGVAVDWAGILFDRMQIAEARDKRRSPSLTKLVPYLGAIFSYVLQVPMGSVVYPEVTKRRKLEYEFPSGSKMKTINQIEWVASESSKSEVQPVDSKFMFSSLPKISQSGHKPKVFTFRPGKVEEKIDVGKPVFNMAKSFQSPTRSQDSLPGIFSAQEAVNSLAELGRFINNQEAMILTMGAKTAKVEQVERLEKQVMVLNDQLDMVKKDKVELEQRLAVADGKLQERMEDVLQSALEFGGWADGLKMSVDEQFTLFGEQMAQLISDNNFLMNRLTPLMEMEKAALEGQSVSGVLVAEGELDVLKREVQQYTQELWNGATGVFQQHLTKPIDKFQLWFEAAGEQKIRDENVGLKRMVEDLKMQLETEQSINAVVQQKVTTEDDEAKASQMTKVVEEAVTIQSAEAEKNKDEANTDQGIVNPRSA
ncbi:hypothetical protein L7F22_067663 [Adiantum nelumboides]|nr:hypothetical protein [Adiantum nelumboides]